MLLTNYVSSYVFYKAQIKLKLMLNNALNNYSHTYDEYQGIFFEKVEYKLRNDDMREIVWRIGWYCLKREVLLKLWPFYTKTRIFMQETQARSRLSCMLYNVFSLNTFGYHILITTKLEIPSYSEIDLGNWISHNIEGIQKLPTRKLKLGNMKMFLLFYISHTKYFCYLLKQRNASM